MKTLYSLVVVCVIATVVSGCMSSAVVISRNRRVEATKLFRASMLADGRGVGVGINLLSLTPGVMATWKDEPGLMTLATFTDLVPVAIAAYMKYQKDNEDNDDSSESVVDGTRTVTINVSGENNTVIYKTDNSVDRK